MTLPVMLSLDTSHMKGSVAVSKGAEVLCEVLFDASDTHSATLMPAVDVCLATAKVSLSEVDRFAVVVGPGSFTGLRIGLATVKAFAAIRGRSVVPVPGLEVLAAAFPYARDRVFPLIDARRGEVYGALYETTAGTPAERVPPFSARPADVAAIAAAAGVEGPLILCGTGALRYRDLLARTFPGGSVIAGEYWAVPRASLLAALAHHREAVSYVELQGLEPLYIRSPDARLPSSSKLKAGGGADG